MTTRTDRQLARHRAAATGRGEGALSALTGRPRPLLQLLDPVRKEMARGHTGATAITDRVVGCDMCDCPSYAGPGGWGRCGPCWVAALDPAVESLDARPPGPAR